MLTTLVDGLAINRGDQSASLSGLHMLKVRQHTPHNGPRPQRKKEKEDKRVKRHHISRFTYTNKRGRAADATLAQCVSLQQLTV